MTNMKKLIVVSIAWMALSGAAVSAQQHVMPPGMSHEEHLRLLAKDDALKQRGALAMGFDQDASVHHFLLQPNGGTIAVASKDTANAELIAQIRAHFRDIADAFQKGVFEKPVATHEEMPPGAKTMADRKEKITYSYVERPDGATVVIETRDRRARKAIHDFLRYQIVEHKTGDPLKPR
jgi:hypothetical protein